MTLEQALNVLSEKCGIRMTLAGNAAPRASLPVRVRYQNASTGLVLRWLTRSSGLTWRFRDGEIVLERPTDFAPMLLHCEAAERRVAEETAVLTAAVNAAMNREIAPAELPNQPLGEALAWFREKMGIDIVCEPACEPKLTRFWVSFGTKNPEVREALEGLTYGQALALAFKSSGMRIGVRDGAILVLADRAAEPPPPKDVRYLLSQQIVTFRWTDKPAEEAIASLARTAGITVIVDPPAADAARRTLNLKLKDVPADVALEFVLRRCHLSAWAIDGLLHIGKAD